jgi:hypothetical protein
LNFLRFTLSSFVVGSIDIGGGLPPTPQAGCRYTAEQITAKLALRGTSISIWGKIYSTDRGFANEQSVRAIFNIDTPKKQKKLSLQFKQSP